MASRSLIPRTPASIRSPHWRTSLNTLSLVFSPVDLVRILGPNSAAFVDHAADRGTLEPGKLGDILLLTGNPLDGYWNFLKPVVVIKGGKVVVDKRGKLRTIRTL